MNEQQLIEQAIEEEWNGWRWEFGARMDSTWSRKLRSKSPTRKKHDHKITEAPDNEIVWKIRKVRSSRSLLYISKSLTGKQLEGPRDYLRFGIELVKRNSGRTEEVLGYALIGLGISRVPRPAPCANPFCFRHAANTANGRGSRYCDLHAKAKSEPGYLQARRVKERLTRHLVNFFPGEHRYQSLRNQLIRACMKVMEEFHQDFYQEIGLENSPATVPWREKVSEWSAKYTWLKQTLLNARSWQDTVQLLRRTLRDSHCYSSSMALWEAKLACRHLEQQIPAKYDRRRRVRSDLPACIREFAKSGLSKSQIATMLGVHKSAVSKCLARYPELQGLFAETKNQH